MTRLKFKKSNAYYSYVLERDRIENEHRLLGELISENEQVMLDLDESLRENLNKSKLTYDQKERIKELTEIQEAISYLKNSIEISRA